MKIFVLFLKSLLIPPIISILVTSRGGGGYLNNGGNLKLSNLSYHIVYLTNLLSRLIA